MKLLWIYRGMAITTMSMVLFDVYAATQPGGYDLAPNLAGWGTIFSAYWVYAAYQRAKFLKSAPHVG